VICLGFTPFRGLPASSSILQERQQEAVEGFKSQTIDEVMEKARARVLRMLKDSSDDHEIDKEIKSCLEQEGPAMTYQQKADITREILDELRGYGPLSELINDPDISDIIVVNHQRILYEKHGEIYTYQKNGRDLGFRSNGHLRLLIERLCMLGQGRIDESQPDTVVHVDGMRVTLTIPPIGEDPTIAIRKFVVVPTLEELVETGSLTPPAAEFLRACSAGRRNLAFCGGMGTGKTTMIATLGRFFGEKELPILIEENRECPLEHPNLRILVARPPNIEGKGAVEIGHLLKRALTMRASRILVSEAKGGEVFYVLQSMNIGHDGGIFTFHADGVEDGVFKRLPSMLMMSKELSDQYDPMRLIGNSLHFVCMLEITDRGVRRFREISEICYDGEQCEVRPIFVRQGEELVATGYIPTRHLEQIRFRGIDISDSLFSAAVSFA
jgi:pilus assembly protein CpaF